MKINKRVRILRLDRVEDLNIVTDYVSNLVTFPRMRTASRESCEGIRENICEADKPDKLSRNLE